MLSARHSQNVVASQTAADRSSAENQGFPSTLADEVELRSCKPLRFGRDGVDRYVDTLAEPVAESAGAMHHKFPWQEWFPRTLTPTGARGISDEIRPR